MHRCLPQPGFKLRSGLPRITKNYAALQRDDEKQNSTLPSTLTPTLATMSALAAAMPMWRWSHGAKWRRAMHAGGRSSCRAVAERKEASIDLKLYGSWVEP